MRDHFVKTLYSKAEFDPNIVLITGDLGFGVLDQFAIRFPNQYINAGVAEQNMTGLATGLGMSGKVVFTYSIANFNTFRCLEQIRNDACYHNANVNIVSIGGGFSYGSLGYSHHATEDIAIMRALPNIKVFTPCSFWEAVEITKHLTVPSGVNYLRIDKSSAPIDQDTSEIFEPGKARVIIDGTDCTVIACGGILEEALKAIKKLKGEGISCRLISMHTIKPIDSDAIIKAVQETGNLITLEEHTVMGGLGSAVAEVLVDNNIYPKRFIRMGLKSGFSTIVGSQSFLRKQYGLDETGVYNQIKEIVKSK